MGLDDIVEDNGGSASSSSSSSSSQSSSDDDDLKTIGNPPYRKVFNEEKWEEVKKVIHREMGYQVNVVLNKPAEKRYEILHEAATWSDSDFDPNESIHKSRKRCLVCGVACDQAFVEIEGETMCPHHPAQRVRNSLDEK